MDFEYSNNFTDKTFADFVKKKREEKGLSIRALANLIDVSAVYLSDIEAYNRPAPRKQGVLDSLSLQLGLSEEEEKYLQRAALASRSEDLDIYLKDQPRVCLALRMAQELPDDVMDQEWEKFITRMIEINSEQQNIDDN